MCTSKFGVVAANIIIMVMSLVMLLIGTIIQSYLSANYQLFLSSISIPTILTITFGSVLLLTTMLALISVFCRNEILLTFYIYTLGFLLIIQLAIGIGGFVMKSHILSMIADSLVSAEYRYRSDSQANSTWNAVQRDLQCCGFYHYDEWFHYLGNSTLPDSCCTIYSTDCGKDAVKTGNFLQTNCARAIYLSAKKYEAQFAVLFPLMLILQFVSLVCARRYIRVLNLFNSFEDHHL